MENVGQPIGMKFDKRKPRMSLMPKGVINSVIAVLEFGAGKYKEDNWKRVEDGRTRYYDATMRHVGAWWDGEKNDPETNMPHLAHAVCCLAFLMWLDDEQKTN